MLIKRPDDIRPSEITPESVFRNRREILAAAGFAGAGSARWRPPPAPMTSRPPTGACRA